MTEADLSLWVGRVVLLWGGLTMTAFLLNALSQFAWRKVRHKGQFWSLFVRWQLRRRKRRNRRG